MDCYYTYLLIDPRNNLPFYVGKGKGRRCFDHVREARCTTKNSAKLQKIRKIESMGLAVVVRKVEENVSDDQAKELEILVIAEARAKGIALTNRTNGGDGASGYKHTAESIKKLSEALKGRIVSDEVKEALRIRLLQFNPMHTPEARAKRSGEGSAQYGKPARNRGVPMSDEQRQRLSAALSGENHPYYGKTCSPERRAAIIAGTKGVKKSDTSKMRKPKAKMTCHHCGKVGSIGNIHRWHLDNCKLRKQ